MKRLFIFFIVFGLAIPVFGQQKTITVVGKISEGNGRQPVEYATVVIGDKTSEQPITGTTTETDGSFEIQTTAEDFYVEVSFIGYVSRRIDELSVVDNRVDLGDVLLVENGETLDEVIVRAEKSQTEFKLDKRVFNVGKDLSTTGASALEVLDNVPSVNVNIEGEISLRGSSGVQVLINGKPSVIASESGNALGTITADMIEKIEVITNPSAKYEAEGTSGIINIVIKKEERKGLNGSLTLNTGIPHNHSLGLSLNRRTEKFNLFSQLGVGYRKMPTDVETINRSLVNDFTTESIGEEFRNEQFYNFILGTDYIINERNVITLSGFFAYEIEDQPSETFFTQRVEGAESSWLREEETEATNPKYQYELNYKRDFKDHEDHTLVFSALGNLFSKDQSSVFTNTPVSGNPNITNEQLTRTNFSELRHTFKLDYTKPFSDKITLETGAQYVINDVSNDFAVIDIIDDREVVNENLTNVFDFNQKVLGVYSTAAYEGDVWGVKVGLRAENTDLETLLETTNEANNRNFTNLFPTLHTSYKLNERFSLQAGYSRRIYRPRLWDLNPFFNIRNNFSIRTGNPNLQPEFTDSYEIGSIYIVGSTSINFNVYHRYTTDVIERISFFEDNVNTTRPDNIGTNRSTGLELNAKFVPSKKVTINGDINYNRFNREGMFEQTSFDFAADRWSTRWTTKIKLPADFETEISARYESGVETVQGNRTGFAFGNLGVRKKILNGKGVLNLSVRDIFATRIRESETIQETFYSYRFGQRGRFITFGFSYGFGKGEAMEFSGQKRRH